MTSAVSPASDDLGVQQAYTLTHEVVPMHLLLGVFVPDEALGLGRRTVLAVVKGMMGFYHEDYQLDSPYRQYFTEVETHALAAYHGIEPTQLKALAEAIAEQGEVIGDADQVFAWGVVGTGATRSRLYCLTTASHWATHDYYAIGGRWDGVLAEIVPDGLRRRRGDGLNDLIRANLAPVEWVLASVTATGEPEFHSFLDPEGRWSNVFPWMFTGPEAEHRERVKMLRRFRRGHHVLAVDYHF